MELCACRTITYRVEQEKSMRYEEVCKINQFACQIKFLKNLSKIARDHPPMQMH